MAASWDGRKSLAVLSAIVILSSFTFVWNITRYPEIQIDEGFYIHNALTFATRGVAIEDSPYNAPTKYTHPPLGWIMLGSFLRIGGFPDTYLQEMSSDAESLSMLYFEPRLFTALLAVIDVVLIYLIANRVYRNKSAGLFASAIFAVTEPTVTYFRWVMLDPIMTTLILASVVIMLLGRGASRSFLSGILLGAAILTKLPAVFFIPAILLGVYMFQVRPKREKAGIWYLLLLWLIGVVVTTMLWPLYALIQGELPNLIESQIWHVAGRAPVIPIAGFAATMEGLLKTYRFLDLGLISTAYLLISRILPISGLPLVKLDKGRKKDMFIPAMCISYLVFFWLFGLNFNNYYIMPVIPFLAITSAKFLLELLYLIESALKRLTKVSTLPLVILIVFVLILAGSFQALRDVSKYDSAGQFEAASYVLNNAPNGSIVLVDPSISWFLERYPLLEVHILPGDVLQQNRCYYVIFDHALSFMFGQNMKFDEYEVRFWKDFSLGEAFLKIYNSTEPIAQFESFGKISVVRANHRCPQYP